MIRCEVRISGGMHRPVYEGNVDVKGSMGDYNCVELHAEVVRLLRASAFPEIWSTDVKVLDVKFLKDVAL